MIGFEGSSVTCARVASCSPVSLCPSAPVKGIIRLKAPSEAASRITIFARWATLFPFILLTQHSCILNRLFTDMVVKYSQVLRELAYRRSIAFSINFQSYPGSLLNLLVIADSGLTHYRHVQVPANFGRLARFELNHRMVPVFADLDFSGRDACGEIFDQEGNRRVKPFAPPGRHRELRAAASYQRRLGCADFEIEIDRLGDRQWRFGNLGGRKPRPNAGDPHLHPSQLLNTLIVDLRLANDSDGEYFSRRSAIAFQVDRGLRLPFFNHRRAGADRLRQSQDLKLDLPLESFPSLGGYLQRPGEIGRAS